MLSINPQQHDVSGLKMNVTEIQMREQVARKSPAEKSSEVQEGNLKETNTKMYRERNEIA